MQDNIEIITYNDNYKDETINFLIGVAINEFGFEEWRDYFYKAKFLELQSDKENFWLALKDGEVVGTIGITDDDKGNVAKLHSLYVRYDCRNQYVATFLYSKALSFCIRKGYQDIILHTYDRFQAAIKFYEKMGYTKDPSLVSSDGFWFRKSIANQTIWNDYFTNLRNKYNMRVSLKNPLIINLDGKGITKNVFFSLLDNTEGGFLDIMEKTVKYFTTRYKCYAVFGTDEVSFIFDNPVDLINDINKHMNNKADEIVSMFSQYFFDYFMSQNPKEKVFWHGEVLSIPESKVQSYVKYKSGLIKNVLTTYFLKKNGVKNSGNIKLETKMEKINNMDGYDSSIKEIENGLFYYNGERYDINEFIKDKSLVKLDTFIEEDDFFGLDDF